MNRTDPMLDLVLGSMVAALMGGWVVALVAAAGLAGYAFGFYAVLPVLQLTGWPG